MNLGDFMLKTITKSRLKTLENKKPLLAYFGHHKAASSWILSILSNICKDLGLKRFSPNNPTMFNLNLNKYVSDNKIDFLLYRNADFKYVKELNFSNLQGFHVVRDPRDVIVSAYFSHLYSHPITKHWPELKNHREQLLQLSKNEGLLLELEHSRKILEQMYNWDYFLPNVLELKMEELTQNPVYIFTKILKYLEILDESANPTNSILNQNFKQALNYIYFQTNKNFPIHIYQKKISLQKLNKFIDEQNFEKKTKGRKKGQENIKKHYRKGVHGDWKNHLNKEHIEFIRDNYNELIIKLNYEDNYNWWKEYLD